MEIQATQDKPLGTNLTEAFDRLTKDVLEQRGFQGDRGHYVRKNGDVIEVVELQIAVFGGRVTANLGLDLGWLKPATRWIERPALGPHAHDTARWTRIGMVTPAECDRWWSYDESAAIERCRDAAAGVRRAILEHGISWLAAEGAPGAFLRHAQDKVERSKSPRHPRGRFAELRLLAAVLAWNGLAEEARETADLARSCWSEERSRLSSARLHYKKIASKGRMPSVPNLVRELEELVSSPCEIG